MENIIGNTNIGELRKIILSKDFDASEAEEFLDAIQDEVNSLQTELREQESEIDSLTETIIEFEMNDELDFGIGKLKYKSDGNIVVDELMDIISERCGKVGIQSFIQSLKYTI